MSRLLDSTELGYSVAPPTVGAGVPAGAPVPQCLPPSSLDAAGIIRSLNKFNGEEGERIKIIRTRSAWAGFKTAEEGRTKIM
jgi:hypothetical protein